MTCSAVGSLLSLVPSLVSVLPLAVTTGICCGTVWTAAIHPLGMSSRVLLDQEGLTAAPCWLCGAGVSRGGSKWGAARLPAAPAPAHHAVP